MNENGPRFFEPPPATAKAAFVSGMAAYDKLVGEADANPGRLDRNVERGLGDKTAILFEADDIRFGDNLPKPRSGKIIRRLLRSIAKGEAITQGISSLENPAVLEQLSERN